MSKNNIEKLEFPLPDLALKYKIDKTYDYLDRTVLNQTQEPSIVYLKLKNTGDNITCVEFERNCNILLVGLINSQIIAYRINENHLKHFD